MTTQTDLTALNGYLATAYDHSGSATDLLAAGNTTAAEFHMIAVAYAIAGALDTAASIGADVAPPPPPPPPPPPTMVKPLLWGRPQSAASVSALKGWGFGSGLMGVEWLNGFGGNPLTAYPAPPSIAKGLPTYLSFYLVNYWNARTPMVDWFDAADQKGKHWADLLASITATAAYAKQLGCVGLALDTEMYGSNGGTATWAAAYAGNTQSASVTAAIAQTRGQAVMNAIQTGFPGAEVIVYLSGKSMLPGLYLDQLNVHNMNGVIASAGLVVLPFMAGLVSATTASVTFLDSTFYKPNNVTPGPYGGDPDHGWARSLAATTDGFAALGLGPNAFISPFVWLDGDVANEGAFATPTIPSTFKAFLPQVLAASQNGMYGIFQYADTYSYASFAPVNGII